MPCGPEEVRLRSKTIGDGRFVRIRLRSRRVHDGLVGEHVYLVVQMQVSGGMELSHEDDNHLLFRVDDKSRVEETTPIVLARGPKFLERRFYAADSEAESEGFVGRNPSQLVVGHELDGFRA